MALRWTDYLPRWMRWMYAVGAGYFWIKCQRCGKGFAGFQWRASEQTVNYGSYGGACVYCPFCAS